MKQRQFTNFQNQEVLAILQVERHKAIDQIEQIAALPGFDVCLTGPNDLTLTLGAASSRDPVVVGAIEWAIAACDSAGIVSRIRIGDVEELGMWMRKGMPTITCSSDSELLCSGAPQVTLQLRRLSEAVEGAISPGAECNYGRRPSTG